MFLLQQDPWSNGCVVVQDDTQGGPKSSKALEDDFPIQGTIIATSLPSGDAMAFNFGLTLHGMEVRAQPPAEDTRSALDRLPGALGTLSFGSVDKRRPAALPSGTGDIDMPVISNLDRLHSP